MRRKPMLLLLTGWLFVVLLFAIWLGAETIVGCGDFSPGDSNAGTQRWVWMPPGTECSWTVTDGTHTERPPLGRYPLTAILGVFPIATVLVFARRRQSA